MIQSPLMDTHWLVSALLRLVELHNLKPCLWVPQRCQYLELHFDSSSVMGVTKRVSHILLCVWTWQESCQTFVPKAAELPSHARSLFRRKSLQPRTQESCVCFTMQAFAPLDVKQGGDPLLLQLFVHPNHQRPFVECLCSCPLPLSC